MMVEVAISLVFLCILCLQTWDCLRLSSSPPSPQFPGISQLQNDNDGYGIVIAASGARPWCPLWRRYVSRCAGLDAGSRKPSAEQHSAGTSAAEHSFSLHGPKIVGAERSFLLLTESEGRSRSGSSLGGQGVVVTDRYHGGGGGGGGPGWDQRAVDRTSAAEVQGSRLRQEGGKEGGGAYADGNDQWPDSERWLHEHPGRAARLTVDDDHDDKDVSTAMMMTDHGGRQVGMRSGSRRRMLLDISDAVTRHGERHEQHTYDGGGFSVRVNNGSELLEKLFSPSETPVVIIVTGDISLHNEDLSRDSVPPNAHITLKGDCGDRMCVIQASDGCFSWDKDQERRGSFSVYDLEFKRACFKFVQLDVELRNCVFRWGGGATFTYTRSVRVETDNGSSSGSPKKTVKMHGCFFVNGANLMFTGLPDSVCISESMIYNDKYRHGSLSITETDFSRPKDVRISNSEFGTWESSKKKDGGNSERFGVSLIFGNFGRPAAAALPVVDSPNNISISFVGCRFHERERGHGMIEIKANVTALEWSRKTAAGLEGNTSISTSTTTADSLSPFLRVRFCDSGPPNEKGKVADLTQGDVRVTPCTDASGGGGVDRAVLVQKCPSAVGDGGQPPPINIYPLLNEAVVDSGGGGFCEECAARSSCQLSAQAPETRINSPARMEREGRGVVPLAVVIPVSVAGALLIAVLAAWVAWRFGRCRMLGRLPEEVHHLKRFTLAELTEATENFTIVIGKGASGVVFKATLPESGEVVAVKSLKQENWRSEKDFVHEVSILGRITHRNLVALQGFCLEGDRYFLVYQYLPNGTLKDHLHRPMEDSCGSESFVLDWPSRLRIAREVAIALEFLHHHLNPPVVHRDVKPENVLLLDDFTPKVADFGLCRKIDRQGDKSFRTVPAGTLGYMAPEVFAGLSVTERVDVYSYGVLLLEIVSGRRPFAEDFSLVDWVKKTAKDPQSAQEIADAKLQGAYDADELYAITRLAKRCLRLRPEQRPTMKTVLRALESIQSSKSMEFMFMDSGTYTDEDQWLSALYVPRVVSKDDEPVGTRSDIVDDDAYDDDHDAHPFAQAADAGSKEEEESDNSNGSLISRPS